jgi:dienelactone hydrolase
LAGPVFAGALVVAGGAGAEIFKKEDLLRGITITHAQCDATEHTLWLNVRGRDFCVRYYLSTAGGDGARPVVFMDGDQLGKINTKTWTWLEPSEARDRDSEELQKDADAFSKLAKTTAIVLARIGVDGTSGNHLTRKSYLELDLMNAALDALKKRYKFEGYHLAGQSGGSRLAAGLIPLRHDVACAVFGSGRLITTEGRKNPDPGRSFFELNIPSIAKEAALRPYVLTDKSDKQVPAEQQTSFVQNMRKAGRQVPQLFIEATDDRHHGAMSYAELVIAGCVLGKTDDEIARAVSSMVKRNAEYNERRRKETAAKASILAAAKQAIPVAHINPAGN